MMREWIEPIADFEFFAVSTWTLADVPERGIAKALRCVHYEIQRARSDKNIREIKEELEKRELELKKKSRSLGLHQIWVNMTTPEVYIPFLLSEEELARTRARIRRQESKHAAALAERDRVRDHCNDLRSGIDRLRTEIGEKRRQKQRNIRRILSDEIVRVFGKLSTLIAKSLGRDEGQTRSLLLILFFERVYARLMPYLDDVDQIREVNSIRAALEDSTIDQIFCAEERIEGLLWSAAERSVEEILLRSGQESLEGLLRQLPREPCMQLIGQCERLRANVTDFDVPAALTDQAGNGHRAEILDFLHLCEADHRRTMAVATSLIEAAEPFVRQLEDLLASCEKALEAIERERSASGASEQEILFVLGALKPDAGGILSTHSPWLTAVKRAVESSLDLNVDALLDGTITRGSVLKEVRDRIDQRQEWRLLHELGNIRSLIDEQASSLEILRDKVAFSVSLSSELQREEEARCWWRNNRIARTEYRRWVTGGLEAGWSKRQLREALRPIAPRSRFAGLARAVALTLFLGLVPL